ncbi:hypothetical protein SAMN03159439_00036 [Pseudomonas sp. NFACC04-2]|nr:hypothetical protein SAMN03159439_00036 [Pseudomonas sp. NFACC04-2]
MDYRHREQLAHTLSSVTHKKHIHHKSLCGSELARDSDRPINDDLIHATPCPTCPTCKRLERNSLGDSSNCFLNERLKCAESVKPHL